MVLDPSWGSAMRGSKEMDIVDVGVMGRILFDRVLAEREVSDGVLLRRLD